VESSRNAVVIGKKFIGGNFRFQQTSLTEITDTEFASLVQLESGSKKKNVKKTKENSKLILAGGNEDELQAFLTNNKERLKAIDTYKGVKDAIEFMPPREFQDCVAYANTGKADFLK
jgi:hypothetical protein